MTRITIYVDKEPGGYRLTDEDGNAIGIATTPNQAGNRGKEYIVRCLSEPSKGTQGDKTPQI